MIVLLSCSRGWCQSDASLSSTGEFTNDSVLVAISDLRVANAKMIELKYEKDINNNLKEIIKNDSVAIVALREDNSVIAKQAKKYKRQRNVVSGASGVLVVLLILALL